MKPSKFVQVILFSSSLLGIVCTTQAGTLEKIAETKTITMGVRDSSGALS
jgi:hypothetical protein